MSFKQGELGCDNPDDVENSVSWFLAYYHAAGFAEYYEAEDPGDKWAMQCARTAFSGGSGLCGEDILWAMRLARRWPYSVDALDDEGLTETLPKKAEEVHNRRNPAPAGEDRWGSWIHNWSQYHGQKGLVTVVLGGKEGAAAGKSRADPWSGYKD